MVPPGQQTTGLIGFALRFLPPISSMPAFFPRDPGIWDARQSLHLHASDSWL